MTEKCTPNPKRWVRKGETHYVLPCCVCGAEAVEFRVGTDRFHPEATLLYTGIVHGMSLDVTQSKKVFAWLEKGNIKAVHAFVAADSKYAEGMDAYCPPCDQVYCKTHYNTREEYDDGFYDCTYGTCPKGHHRMIDD